MLKAIPNPPAFKEAYKERYSKITDWEEYEKYSYSYLRRSIRVNTLKSTVKEVKERLESQGWILTPIPWCSDGFWIDHVEGRRDIGATYEHSLGYYYVQEAASMIPPLVMDIKPGMTVLDMCASPGSKTTQIGMYLQGEGFLVGNDYKGIRLAPLGINLQRCGVLNSAVTLMKGQQFKTLGEVFDRVLVDAPCSGTGTIRKSLKTITMWNPKTLLKFPREQLSLLNAAWECTRKGGVIVYSTCSNEPEEDEGVISAFLEKHPDAEILPIELPGLKYGPAVTTWGDEEYDPQVKNTIRLWPQDNDTEGFFIAKIRKT